MRNLASIAISSAARTVHELAGQAGETGLFGYFHPEQESPAGAEPRSVINLHLTSRYNKGPPDRSSGPRFEVWVSRDAMPASFIAYAMDASGASALPSFAFTKD